MSIIFKANQKAIEDGWDWDTIFATGQTEMIAEFETPEEAEEAEEAFKSGGYDPDLYGVF